MENNKNFGVKQIIITAVASAVLGALIMFLLNTFVFNKNNTVMSIKGYKLRKTDLYDKMKLEYGLSYGLEMIDNRILKDKYKLTDEMKQEIEKQAEDYIKAYEQYGYGKEEFLELYGFKSYEDFIEDLSNRYRQDLHYTDYIVNLLGEDTIKAYYEEEGNIYGDINVKHILVQTSESVTDEQAKDLAKTIISELNSGSSWEEVIEKYEGKIISEDLGYQGMSNNLEASFMNALIAMENNSYSKEPVQTSYGYHVIYRLDQKEKPTYEQAKKTIANKLFSQEESQDTYKAFLELEKEYGIKIKDEELKKQYDEFVNNLN